MTVNSDIGAPRVAEAELPRAPSTIAALRLQMLAAVLIPLALLAAAGLESRRDIVAQAGDRVERIAAAVDEHAQKVIESDRLILDRVRDLDPAHLVLARPRDANQVGAALAGMVAGIPQIQALWLWDAQGRPLAVSRHTAAAGRPDITDSPAYGQLRAGQTEMLIPPSDSLAATSGTSGDQRVFSLARRLSHPDGSLAGIAAVSMSLAYFDDFYRRVTQDDPATTVLLVNREGMIMAGRPVAMDGAQVDPICPGLHAAWRAGWPAAGPATGPAAGAEGAPDAGSRDASPPDAGAASEGQQRLTACRLIANAPLTVMVGVDRAQLDRQWHRRLGWLALLALPVMGALCATTLLAMRRARRERLAAQALRAAETRREQAEGALLRTQRLQALDQITGGIIHDFANLLMTVRSGAEVLCRRPHTEPQREVLDAMLQAIAWGERLTHNLRTFSRRPRLHLDLVRLSDMAGDIADLLRPALRGDIRLETALPPSLWPLRVDRTEFDLALLNMAVNARDAMPRGGVLRLAAANVHIDPASHESDRTGGLMGDFVRLTVCDTGSGIPPDILDRVFDPFFTTKRDGKSTGLGLAQVHGLARQSGGAALADSLNAAVPNSAAAGTTITLYLPRAEEDAATATGTGTVPAKGVAANGVPEVAGNGRQILLVEDNPTVAKVMRDMVEALGFRVLAATTADAAQSLLADRPDISLMVSDIVLPGGRNGLELAQAVRHLHPGLPVLLVSGYGDRVAEAESLGFAIVPKPLDSTQLRQAISRCLGAR
ncbi:ATP-binding protein [Nitrospirillum amazonense]|uniref:histidine kinase n=1 Tax=Nitrospirillum amazonense TaxID=28077 RepID=A0A560KIJ2_9PROT|nr:ATP-binding protein [Nitrospirillum amazonense]MDG3444383.1 response regulator [Nitrospirillum amazonense]TWB83012.1 two-component system NtrC family sensor kinase [Nitrospirillum amazonense]